MKWKEIKGNGRKWGHGIKTMKMKRKESKWKDIKMKTQQQEMEGNERKWKAMKANRKWNEVEGNERKWKKINSSCRLLASAGASWRLSGASCTWLPHRLLAVLGASWFPSGWEGYAFYFSPLLLQRNSLDLGSHEQITLWLGLCYFFPQHLCFGSPFLLSLSVSWSDCWKRAFWTPPCPQSTVVVVVVMLYLSYSILLFGRYLEPKYHYTTIF